MKFKIVFMVMLAMLMLAPIAGAVFTATWSYPLPLSRNELLLYPNMNLTLAGTTPGRLYNYTAWFGRDASTGFTGDVVKGSFTGNGVKPVPITLSYYPFDGVDYEAHITITEQFTGNVVVENRSFCFGPAYGKPYHASLTDSTPSMLYKYGGDFLTQGFSIGATSLHTTAYPNASSASIPIYVLVTDNSTARHILGWGVSSASWRPDIGVNGTKPWSINWKFNVISFKYFSSYYIYLGIPITDSPLVLSDANFDLTVDQSMSRCNFSVNHVLANPHLYVNTNKVTEWNTTNGYLAGEDHFIGAVVYFETVPSAFSGSGWKPGAIPSSSVGMSIDAFGIVIGIPFLSILIAFLIVAICVMIPWRLAIKYQFDLPNFIYGIAVIGGMVLSLVLSIIALWMFVLFIGVISLIMFLAYREQIEGVLGFASGVPWSQRATAEAEPFREEQRLAHVSRMKRYKEIGVLGLRQTKAMEKRLGQRRDKTQKNIERLQRDRRSTAWKPGRMTVRTATGAAYLGRKGKKWWTKRQKAQMRKASRSSKRPFIPYSAKLGKGARASISKNGKLHIKQLRSRPVGVRRQRPLKKNGRVRNGGR